MQDMDRKGFMKLLGAGSVAAAAAAGAPLASGAPLAAQLISRKHDTLTFRASRGVPEPPLAAYATHVVEGTVDIASGRGLVTSRVLAGHPGDPSVIGLPGASRLIRISQVIADGKRYRLRGVIEDRSHLQRGESPQVVIVVDQAKKLVHAPFVGHKATLPIA
jgi:hypothetical protein